MTKREVQQVRAIIMEIRGILRKGDEVSSALWDVLSAVRGPDDGSLSVKECTTAVIRWRLFGNSCRARGAAWKDSPSLKKGREKIYRDLGGGSHFVHHVKDAFSALDDLGL